MMADTNEWKGGYDTRNSLLRVFLLLIAWDFLENTKIQPFHKPTHTLTCHAYQQLQAWNFRDS